MQAPSTVAVPYNFHNDYVNYAFCLCVCKSNYDSTMESISLTGRRISALTSQIILAKLQSTFSDYP